MRKKLTSQINYYLHSKVFTLIYLAIFLLYAILLINTDPNLFIEEGLMHFKILIIILNIFYILYLTNVKLYEYTLYFSYQRKYLAGIYLRLYLSYAVISSLFLFATYNLVGYYKIKYFHLDINLLFSLLYFFCLVILINAVINLIFGSIIGLILTFLINLIILFLAIIVTDNSYFPNIYYNGSYYFLVDTKYLIIYLLGLFILFNLIFRLKERR